MRTKESVIFRAIDPGVLRTLQALPTDDLLTLMSFPYGLSFGSPDNPMFIGFGDPTGLNHGRANHCLKVSRSRKNAKITEVSIAANESVTDSAAAGEFSALVTGWKAELEAPLADNYAFRVLFTRRRARGHFTYSPDFSIREVPADWPFLEHGGGLCPFIITFRYRARPNDLLKRKAEAKQARVLSLFFNILIPDGISTLPHDFVWAVDVPSVAGQPATSSWCQVGYMPGPTVDIPALSSLPEGQPTMRIVPAYESYNPMGPDGIDELFIPSCLEDTYDKFVQLDPAMMDAFCAAARHLSIAGTVVSDSISYGYIALVSAVETIANQWSAHWWPTEICESCNQQKYKLGYRFREFLKAYARKDGAALYRQFYDTRSSTLHAGAFLRGESMGLWDAGFEGSSAHPNFHYLTKAVRVAIINWLENPLRAPIKT